MARLKEDWEPAIAHYQASWQMAFQHGAHYTQPQILEGRASVAVGQGEPEKAAELLGAAAALRKAHDIPVSPADRADLEGIITRVQTQLPADRLEQLEQQGAGKKIAELAMLL